MCNTRIDEIAFQLVSDPWFDRVILATITVNGVFLALYDPTKESAEQEAYLTIGDYVFSGIFIAELLVKWLALSIPTYFKDKWNWVDFIVVVESVVSLVLEVVRPSSSLDISALRGLRVLRPLRAITYIQQVKLLFETVISAFKVVNTLFLCVGCVLLFFGNVGYTYWADAFSYTCVDSATLETLSERLVCGGGYSCPDGYSCEDAGRVALNHGVTGYQDIWHAMLQVFQVVSLDGWQETMWSTQDAAGEATWIFFVLLLILGNVLLVSMFPAVLSTKLEAAIQREDKRKRLAAQAEDSTKTNVKDNKGKRASEFETLLNEYSKMEANEIASFQRLAAVRRGDIREEPEEEPPSPRWTPFPDSPLLIRLRKAVLLELGPFSLTVYSLIFLNAFVLSLDHAGASESKEEALTGLNKAFTVMFAIETVFKLGLLGPIGYFSDGYNAFDFVITLLNLVESTMQVGGFYSGLRVIRIFRIARVLRLASLGKLGRTKFNPSPQVDLGRLVSIVVTSTPWILNIYAVQLLLMYTFTVLGMQFFGGAIPDLNESDNSIRLNYNSFGKAAVTMLDLFTGNLWSEVMFDTVGATGEQTGIIFYVVWLVLSRWLVVAMVVTVLFYRIDVDTEDYLKVAAKTSMRSVFALESAIMQCHKSHVFFAWRRHYEETTGNRSSNKGQIKLLKYSPPAMQPGLWKRTVASSRSLLIFDPHNPIRELCRWLTSSAMIALPMPQHGDLTSTITVAPGGGTGTGGSSRYGGTGGSGKKRWGDTMAMAELTQFTTTSTLSGAPGQGCWRDLIRREGLHRRVRLAVEAVTTVAVVVMMVVVSLDVELSSGRRTADGEKNITRVLEAVAVCIFIVEAAMLIVSRGLLLLPGAYLRDSFDVMNFALTVLSAVCLWAFDGATSRDSFAVSSVKALRALTVARLMKFTYLSHELENLLKALRSSRKALSLAGGVTLFFLLQWSIVGLQVWQGTFGYCSDAAMATENGAEDYYVYRTEENGIEGQFECEVAGYEWKNASWNFDSFGNAMQSVLVVFTFNGWHEILFAAVNARVSSEGLNAEQWNSAWAGLFFLCVLMISIVLVLLVVGVVFSMYTFLNLTKNSGQRLSSLKQAFWTMYAAKLDNMKPDTIPACPRDANPLRRFLFDVATNPRWGILLASLIGASVVVRFLIGSEWLHYSDAPIWIHIQEAVFAAVFVSEWVSRVVAFGGIRAVTRSPFQIADSLSTVVLALVFIDEVVFLTGWMSSSFPFWKVVKAISMVRLVRLGSVLPHVQEILLVAVESSSVVFPLLLILAALTYLWSVCGVIFFGNDTYSSGLFGDGNPWEAVNRHRGFIGVAQGMQTMLGVATTPGSDGWVTLMQRYEDVTPVRWRWGVLLFFGSFALLTRFLLVNFFIITLLFKYKTHSNDKVGVAMEQVNQFKHAWMGHAYTYTKEYRTIYAGQLVSLLRKLPPPLGVGSEGSYYDCQILAKKVLCAMGVDAMAGIPAKQISDVLSPFGSTGGDSSGKHQSPQDGPGLIKLPFSKVLVAVHRIVLFGVTLEDERQIKEHRGRARNNLGVLKLGVHRFLATRAKRRVPPSSLQREEVAVAECSLLRTQLPATFMTRSSMALTAEFLRWKHHVDLRGYDDEANLQGRCLHNAATHEIDTTAALEQLTAKLAELHVGDRKLLSRLAEIRQHIITLKELRAKLDTTRGEYLRTDWDGGSLRVRQVVEEGRRAGLTAMCASMDGAWLFCTTETGLLKVFKKGRAAKAGNGKPRQKGSYSLVQSVGVKPEQGGGAAAQSKNLAKGLCVACSPDGYMVVVGCSDATVRTFAQDTTGLRRAVHAMQAEGKRGRKPTVLYRANSVGKGHHAAVRCVAWLEPGHFYTGEAGGTVCMWRKNKAATPAQAIDVCRSTFFSGAVQCLGVWRTAYGLGLLASCVDVDDSQDVEPPVYLLVGDADGHLSVLPARTDSKFFAIDVWKSSWKQQIETGKGGVTAAEAVWGRVYTASGPSGLIKAWTPRWADATKEKLLGLVQVGQYAVHSGPVSAIVYSKGLMFSAGNDLSIVVWYPPRENSAPPPPPSQQHHPLPTVPLHDKDQGHRSLSHNLDSSQTLSPARAPPSPSSSADESGVGVRVAGTEHELDFQTGDVTHENEPGVVLHVAEVVGMATIPGGIVSADMAGRLVVQGPDRFTESHRVQIMPSEDSIQRFRPMAQEVLKARGSARRSSARGASLEGGASANPTGPATLVPQESLDHLCTFRFLLRAKAKRRLKDEIVSERQRVADLNTATMFARNMGQDRGTPPVQGGPGSRSRGFSTSTTRSSSGDTLKKIRRRSLLHSVSIRVKLTTDGEDVSQDTADVTKMAEMDQKPIFLETSDLVRLADHPNVYLAELMSHFFPGRDLAPPSSSPAARGGSIRPGGRGNAMTAAPGRGAGGGGRVGRSNRGIGVGGMYFRGGPHLPTSGVGRGAPLAMFSATQDVTPALPPQLDRRTLRSSAIGGGRLDEVYEEKESQEDGGSPPRMEEAGGEGDQGGGLASLEAGASRPNLGALIERARRARRDGEEKDGVIAGTPPELNGDTDRTAETRAGKGEGEHDRGVEPEAGPEEVDTTPGGRARTPIGEIYDDSVKVPTGPGAVLISPPLETTSVAVSGEESEELPAAQEQREDLRNVGRNEDVIPQEENIATGAIGHGGNNATAPAIISRGENNTNDHLTSTSYIGDNLSTAQRRRRGGSITVYVPRSPESGVWAAAVEYDGVRDVAWVLSEALRMFARENRPITRHAGLARRPRLVESSGGRLGLFKGGKVWKQSPAFPATSPVSSVLSPGEEVVVLVEGFDPAAAFGKRVSVCIPPPARHDSASPYGWEQLTEAEDGRVNARDVCAVDGLHPFDQQTGAVRGDIRSRYDEKRDEEEGASECEDVEGIRSGGMIDALLAARGRGGDAAALPRGGVTPTIRAPSDGAQRFVRGDEPISIVGRVSVPQITERAVDGGGVDRVGKASVTSGVVGPGVERDWKGNVVGGSHQEVRGYGFGDDGRLPGEADGAYGDGYGDDDDTLTDEEELIEEGEARFRGQARAFHEESPGRTVKSCHQSRTPFQEETSRRTERSGGNFSHPRDNSVTTGGLEGRCEEDPGGREKGDRQRSSTQVGDGGEDPEQQPGAFPEPRSPPRSLVSAMFLAWGNG